MAESVEVKEAWHLLAAPGVLFGDDWSWLRTPSNDFGCHVGCRRKLSVGIVGSELSLKSHLLQNNCRFVMIRAFGTYRLSTDPLSDLMSTNSMLCFWPKGRQCSNSSWTCFQIEIVMQHRFFAITRILTYPDSCVSTCLGPRPGVQSDVLQFAAGLQQRPLTDEEMILCLLPESHQVCFRRWLRDVEGLGFHHTCWVFCLRETEVKDNYCFLVLCQLSPLKLDTLWSTSLGRNNATIRAELPPERMWFLLFTIV